jgi:hypothetical protein
MKTHCKATRRLVDDSRSRVSMPSRTQVAAAVTSSVDSSSCVVRWSFRALLRICIIRWKTSTPYAPPPAWNVDGASTIDGTRWFRESFFVASSCNLRISGLPMSYPARARSTRISNSVLPRFSKGMSSHSGQLSQVVWVVKAVK